MNSTVYRTHEDFKNERLPTLDFEMWISGEKIFHSYFQKEMRTPLVIMERSGMATQQKFQILSNDLNRRLSNVQHGEIRKSEINSKIEQFITELKSSGYCRKQAQEIVCSGIRGYRNKIRKRKRKNTPFYRLGEDTVEDRMRKKIVEKENWYKKDEDDEDDKEENPSKYRRVTESEQVPSSSRRLRAKIKGKKTKDEKSVIFVPHTVGSGLARELRSKEEKMKEITGDKIKIVEKSGIKLEDALTGKDPCKYD